MSDSETTGRETGHGRQRRELSWRTMLILLLLSIVAAAGLAYLLVRVFLHPHPQQIAWMAQGCRVLLRSTISTGIPS